MKMAEEISTQDWLTDFGDEEQPRERVAAQAKGESARAKNPYGGVVCGLEGGDGRLVAVRRRGGNCADLGAAVDEEATLR